MTPEQIKQVYEGMGAAYQCMTAALAAENDDDELGNISDAIIALANAREIFFQTAVRDCYVETEDSAQELVTVKDWAIKAVQESAQEGGIDLTEEQAIQIVADHGHQFLGAARVAISVYLDDNPGFPEVMVLGLEDDKQETE